MSRKLQRMHEARRALDEGRLSVPKCRVLGRALSTRTAWSFASSEIALVDAMADLDLPACEELIGEWLRLADPDGPQPDDPEHTSARHVRRFDQTWLLDAFGSGDGVLVDAAIQAMVDAQQRSGAWEPGP